MKRSITTKTGDRGKTRLYSGEAVSKADLRMEITGTLDELNSVLGVALSQSAQADVRTRILTVQQALFNVAAEFATSRPREKRLRKRIDEAALVRLDRDREALEDCVTLPNGFIIPGGTVVGAHLDHARTVARRCERLAVKLHEQEGLLNPNLLIWLNRLSDYLWLLARFEEGTATILKDEPPQA